LHRVFEGAGPHIHLSGHSVEPWRTAAQRGWPVHVVNHLAAMGDLHRAGRFDRLSDDVLTLTGQGPLSGAGVRPRTRRHLPRRQKAKEA